MRQMPRKVYNAGQCACFWCYRPPYLGCPATIIGSKRGGSLPSGLARQPYTTRCTFAPYCYRSPNSARPIGRILRKAVPATPEASLDYSSRLTRQPSITACPQCATPGLTCASCTPYQDLSRNGQLSAWADQGMLRVRVSGGNTHNQEGCTRTFRTN